MRVTRRHREKIGANALGSLVNSGEFPGAAPAGDKMDRAAQRPRYEAPTKIIRSRNSHLIERPSLAA
jgi:hypothetical protein